MARYFEGLGARNVSDATKVWKTLLGEVLWGSTQALAVRLRAEAIRTGRAQTDSYLEDHPEGRLIIVTVAPARGDDLVLREFPDGDYIKFIEPYRDRLRRVTNWHARDMVHWTFLWDENGQDLSLYYQWSLSKILMALGEGGQQLPLIIPQDFVEKDEFIRYVSDMIRKEASTYTNGRR
jgi:hypothetical protein